MSPAQGSTHVPRFIRTHPRYDVVFEMYGDVILTRDVPESGLRAGDVGTVVERHVIPGASEEGYPVECFEAGHRPRTELWG